jgi:prepilin-type N-terminal cleavage/methylation domain-containing protein
MLNLLHKNKTLSAISYKLEAKKGFTLIEVMVTVSIITLLVSIVGYSWISLSNRAKASKIASDFRKIEGALQEWKAVSHSFYPDDGPEISDFTQYTTTFYPNYLSKVPTDLRGQMYLYDNDSDNYTMNPPGCTSDAEGYTSAGMTSGVNAYIFAFNYQDYVSIAPIVDKSLDNGDGACNGKFRWTLNNGQGFLLIYLISSTP